MTANAARPRTIAQKIIAAHCGLDHVEPGDYVTVSADYTACQELFSAGTRAQPRAHRGGEDPPPGQGGDRGGPHDQRVDGLGASCLAPEDARLLRGAGDRELLRPRQRIAPPDPAGEGHRAARQLRLRRRAEHREHRRRRRALHPDLARGADPAADRRDLGAGAARRPRHADRPPALRRDGPRPGAGLPARLRADRQAAAMLGGVRRARRRRADAGRAARRCCRSSTTPAPIPG